MVAQLTQVLYTAKASAVGGRSGTVETDDGRLKAELAPPRKNSPHATNPEQLFAAGFASCFGSALHEVAQGSGLDVTTAQVDCQVSLGTTENPVGYGLAVTLSVTAPGWTAAALLPLMNRAEATCPYARAVHGNIPVTLLARDSPSVGA